MKNYLRKSKVVFCMLMSLFMIIATFPTTVFADNTSNATNAVTSVYLTNKDDTETGNDVFGKDSAGNSLGIVTGSSELDSKCYDPDNKSNKGYDDSYYNNIIRSHDNITYNVKSNFNIDRNSEHYLVYEVTLPKDPELTIDDSSNGVTVTSVDSADGKSTVYTCKYKLDQGYSGGSAVKSFTVKVGNKKLDDIIKPEIKAYIDDDVNNAKTVSNVVDIIVTTAPMYNIILKKMDNDGSRDIYQFKNETKTTNQGTTTYYQNAAGYTDNKVNGYAQTYGFALEVRKPGSSGGVAGVDFPDPTKPFTFDIDISNFKLKKDDKTEEDLVSQFAPLLYSSEPNVTGGAAVPEIPFTNENCTANKSSKDYCSNSGNITMSQNGNKISVTVDGYDLDMSKFPQTSANKKISYYESLQKMREGVFSAFKFTVVYPYKNQNGDTIQSKYGNGTINYSAKAYNMNAISKSNTTASAADETYSTDNDQSSTVTLSGGGNRQPRVFYSSRNNWLDGYSVAKVWKDEDMSAVGAKDLAFTVQYQQSQVGDAYPVSDSPVAIDQLVLFDRSAIKDVTATLSELTDGSKVDNVTCDNLYVNGQKVANHRGNNNGYDCTILYATYKGGRLENQRTATDEGNNSMRTASVNDFTYSETEPEGGYDALLFQYRGSNTGNKVNLIAQCFANVSNDTSIADNVYMITAVTNIWTAGDLQNNSEVLASVLASAKKTDASDLTRDDWRAWMKNNSSSIYTFDKDNKIKSNIPVSEGNTLDYRSNYTVPKYENNQFVSDNHAYHYTWADALYIVPYTTTVVKSVAQLDSNGNPMQTFNVGRGQNIVDYEVASSIRYGNNVDVPDGSVTTVYFEDKLPKGVTYIDGSAYWGGDYLSAFPGQGKVVNGTQITPKEIIKNSDGTTTIKWEIPNVSKDGGALPKLHYSCKIEDSVKQGDNLNSTVNIQTDEDHRDIYAQNENTSTAGINIVKEQEFYIVKRGKAQLETQDNTGYYELEASNSYGTAHNNLFLVDTMPYDRENKPLKGIYKLNSVSVDKDSLKGVDSNTISLWYTSENKYKGKTANDIDASEVTTANGWKKATCTLSSDGTRYEFTGDGLINDWPTVIVYKQDSLLANSKAVLKLSYNSISASGDKLENQFTTMSGNSEITSTFTPKIYNRTLEGTVWEDKDKDGKLENSETKLEKVKVTLLQQQADGSWKPYTALKEIVKDKDGKYVEKTCEPTLETDANGHYKFTGLPEGKFKVVFNSSDDQDGTKLTDYKVTKDQSKVTDGKDEETSKVKENNVFTNQDNENILESGEITEIKMPSVDEMEVNGQTSYNLPHQNLGLYKETTKISGTKTWADNNNQDGKRPDSITVKVMRGNDVVASKEVTSDNNWEYTFNNLPKYKDGQLIKYTIAEEKVEGYTPSYSEQGYDITNTHTPETVDVKGTKTWDDNNNQDGIRPDSITVNLIKKVNNQTSTVTSKEVTADNNWKYSFENLPKYENGKEIAYSITEDEVANYTTNIDGYNITNTHTPGVISIPVTKVWEDGNNQDGKRPDSVTIKLLANNFVLKTLTLNAEKGWRGSFDNLPVKQNGQAITYSIEEETVSYYDKEITGDVTDGYTVTNTHTPETTNVNGTKTWADNNNQDGIRPSSITVKVMNGKEVVASKEVTAKDNWSYTFEGLAKYNNGKVIKYTIAEDAVEGYETTVSGYNVTNKHIPATTSISGTKTWDDKDNQDGIRPESITVKVMNGKEVVASKEVTAKDNWSYTFEGLAKYNNGQEIVYTVSEDSVEGYTTTVNGYNVTNTHTPETTSISGTKTWDDKDNQDGIRPDSITVKVMNGDKIVASKEVTAKDNWSYTFEGLAKYNNGKVIKYTIAEDAVEGYETTVSGYNVTNKHIPATTSISGTKTWDDKDNQDGIRPESITVKVMNGKEVVASKEVTAKDNWSYTFEGLAKYNNGQEIVYTVSEDSVEGYTTTVNGYNVTNTHTPETTEVTVTKKWDDHDNIDQKRPTSLKVYLYADGKKTDQTIELNEEGDWSGVFDNLDKYKEGKVIEYSVEEEKVESYEGKVTGDQEQGFVITNTYQSPSVPSKDETSSVNKPGNKTQGKDHSNKAKNDKSSINTGDHQEIGLFGILGLASMGGVTLLRRKKED